MSGRCEIVGKFDSAGDLWVHVTDDGGSEHELCEPIRGQREDLLRAVYRYVETQTAKLFSASLDWFGVDGFRIGLVKYDGCDVAGALFTLDAFLQANKGYGPEGYEASGLWIGPSVLRVRCDVDGVKGVDVLVRVDFNTLCGLLDDYEDDNEGVNFDGLTDEGFELMVCVEDEDTASKEFGRFVRWLKKRVG